MKRTVTGFVLAVALTASSVAAQGRDSNMSEDQIRKEMFVSTQGSFPGSSPASSALPQSTGQAGAYLVLGVITFVLILAATRSNAHWYPSY